MASPQFPDICKNKTFLTTRKVFPEVKFKNNKSAADLYSIGFLIYLLARNLFGVVLSQ